MAARMEYQGKDVDEAISNACSGLKVGRDQLEIEIKSTGSAGIFGLCRKNAVVLVSLRDHRTPGGEAPVAAEGQKPSRPRKPRGGRSSGERDLTTAPPAALDAEDRPQEAPVQISAETLGLIKADLEEFLRLMHCPATITMEIGAEQVHARITGEHLEAIVGPEGKTLDAFQYLARKMVSRKFPEKVNLVIDAGEFRAERMKELEETAREFARQVKEEGKTMAFPPLNPAERRIVHMALQDDTEIRSRSIGEGLFKKVLIYQPGKGPKKGKRRRGG